MITLNGLTHPTQKKDYVTIPVVRLEWMSDGALVETQIEKGAVTLLKVNPSNWIKTSLLPSDLLIQVLIKAGANEASAKNL